MKEKRKVFNKVLLTDKTEISNNVSYVNQKLANGWCLIEVGIIRSGKVKESIYYRIKPNTMSNEYYYDWYYLLTSGRLLYTIKYHMSAPDVESIEETDDIKRVEILQTYGNVLLIKLDSNSKFNNDIYSFGKLRTFS